MVFTSTVAATGTYELSSNKKLDIIMSGLKMSYEIVENNCLVGPYGKFCKSAKIKGLKLGSTYSYSEQGATLGLVFKEDDEVEIQNSTQDSSAGTYKVISNKKIEVIKKGAKERLIFDFTENGCLSFIEAGKTINLCEN